MIGILNKAINKFFGTKSDRDLKEITPLVNSILDEFRKIESVSTDELRDKSRIFRERINDHLKEVSSDISSSRERKREP